MRRFAFSTVIVLALAMSAAASPPLLLPPSMVPPSTHMLPEPAGYPLSQPIPTVYAPQSYVPQSYAPPSYAPPSYVPPSYVAPNYTPPTYAPPSYTPPSYASNEAPISDLPTTLPPVAAAPSEPKPQRPLLGPPTPPTGSYTFDPYAREGCCPPRRVEEEYWVRGEWLYWSFRNAPVPPLIVTGDPGLPQAAIPGGGNITPLVGPSRDQGAFNGARVTVGSWFDPDGELGGELGAFLFSRGGSTDVFQGSPALPLSVPFLSTTGVLGAYDFSFPGRATGAIGFSTASQLFGAEANLLHRWHRNSGRSVVSVDGIFGYRFLSLTERLDLFGQTQPDNGTGATFAGNSLPSGATVFTSDSFRTRNEFHGLQVGFRAQARRDMFTITATEKFGMGINSQVLRLDAVSTATGLGAVPGGVRVLPFNGGRFTNTDFSLINEAQIEVGLQVTRHINLRVGYNLLFWSDVLRPGTVVSPVLPLSQVPIDPSFSTASVANRRPQFRSTDFLAHGLTVGAVIDW